MKRTVVQVLLIVGVALLCGTVYYVVLQQTKSPSALTFTVAEGWFLDPLDCTYVDETPPVSADPRGEGGKTAQAPTEARSQTSGTPTVETGNDIPSTPEKTGSGEAPEHPDGLPRILVDDAFSYWEDGALFVDARRTKQYLAGHVSGAILIPAWEPDNRNAGLELVAENFVREEPVVVYCTEDPNCTDSKTIALELKGSGFEDVIIFLGGFPAWKKAGHSVHSGEVPGPRPGYEEEE